MNEYSCRGLLSFPVLAQTFPMPKVSKKAKRPIYFRQWRQHKGMTQDRAAEAAGLSQGTIAKLERGRIAFTQANLEALARAYGCDAADLLRPPQPPRNELAEFLMSLDARKQTRALKILRSHFEDEDAA